MYNRQLGAGEVKMELYVNHVIRFDKKGSEEFPLVELGSLMGAGYFNTLIISKKKSNREGSHRLSVSKYSLLQLYIIISFRGAPVISTEPSKFCTRRERGGSGALNNDSKYAL